jgi:hypothetical protein
MSVVPHSVSKNLLKISGELMLINVLVYIRTSQGDRPAAVESFSRVPCIGEKIQVPSGIFTVIDVTHVATSAGGGSANNPIATILVQSY